MSHSDDATMPVVAIDKLGHEFELRSVDCPTCRVAARRVIGLRGGKSQRHGLGVETRIVQCDRCSLMFPDPFPFPRSPQALYGDPDKYFARHDEAAKVDAYRELARSIATFSGRRDPTILDVGSGRGELLRAAQLEGISRTVGLELSEAMVAYARSIYGFEVIPQTIEQHCDKTTARYDAIVLNAVLEHVYDPDSMMASVARLLAPRGIVYIDIPREPNLLTMVGNRLNRLRGSHAVFNLAPTWPPYHVYGFNPKALRILLAKHGISVLSIDIHYPSAEIPASGQWRDRLLSAVGSQLNRLANLTPFAGNMYVWGRRDF